MSATPTGQQRDVVLDLLKQRTATQVIRDPALNRALAPFRGHPPTALLCGNPTCKRPFLWCAVDPLTGRVRFSASPPAVAGPPGARRRPPPFDRWEPDDHAGESTVPPGEPMLRWRFFCPRCERPCVLSNTRMIALIVRALASGREAIRPAAE